jgi:hypothetical protein
MKKQIRVKWDEEGEKEEEKKKEKLELPVFPELSTSSRSAPSCTKVSIVFTKSFSLPWKCSPATAL